MVRGLFDVACATASVNMSLEQRSTAILMDLVSDFALGVKVIESVQVANL